MASVLSASQTSLRDNLPAQPIIQSDKAEENLQRDHLPLAFPNAEIIPPEFTQADNRSDYALSPINKVIREVTAPNFANSHFVTAVPEELVNRAEFSPSLSFYLSPETPDADESMSQINSVSQLDDIQPTDWAFSALQSIAEHHGCITNMDSGYLGHQAISRYEFATGLKTCLQQIQELITNNKNNAISHEDLMLLQRLQGEVWSELEELGESITAISYQTSE
ncbi:iron uptake porin [Nostoc sp. TCL26-01]|uniref:iron uptake porin n=1 Tax=Nostoc sp. TCL26-01 TaxID=2576904 RepID=UPI001C4B5BED|nr:iron uptake porin [Nostoc sp. TCL26-01]